MIKKVVVVLLVILLSSLVYARHLEWYATTDCYEKSRPNIELCQQKYDELRMAHYDTCVSPSSGECHQYCQQFIDEQRWTCEQKCRDELPLAHFRYLDCLEGKENSYTGVYDYNLKPIPEPKPVSEPKPVLISEPEPELKSEPEPVLIPEPKPTTEKRSVAKASYVKGEVWVTKKDGTRIQITRFIKFEDGDTIESKGGVATIELPDGHKISVGKNSTVILGKENEMSLSFGSIKAFFKKPRLPFDIHTPGATVAIRGTKFVLTYDQKTDSSILNLYEGEVSITTDTGTEIVSAGTSVTFDKGGVVSEKELTEADWESLIEQFEEKINYIFFLIPIILVIAIIGLIVYFIVRKKKTDKKKEKISKLAISSLILGIFSLLFGWLPFLGWIFIILTLVFGFMALKRIKTQNLSGRKLAIAGIVLGLISLVISIIAFVSYMRAL